MLKSLALFSLLAFLPLANAQSSAPAQPDQSQPSAPIVRSYLQDRQARRPDQIVESQPTPGVWLRSESSSSLRILSSTTPQRTEVRLDRGRLNVQVHQPVQHSEILVDLPGGQTSLLKDGLYTFNADTNTVRVLHGEAAYVGRVSQDTDTKPVKIKEDHQLSLVAAPGLKPSELRSVEAYPYELTADLLPYNYGGQPSSQAFTNGYGYGDGPDYPRDDYPYPYYGGYPDYAGRWGYPGYYGYGYPFAYGIGFGYFGGFRGGYGFRSGFRR